MSETAYPVPILGPDGKIDPDHIPTGLPVSDAAVAELVTNGALTRPAVEGVLGDAVTHAELDATLDGYAKMTDLDGFATTADLAAKQDRLPYDFVLYDPATGWENPDPGPGRWRVFDSLEYVQAPSPPSRTGVNRDEWAPHPQSPAWGDV